MTEAALHKAVAEYLDLALPSDAVWHHSPNEGKRGWRAQRAIKSHGVRKGWPDIEIFWRSRAIFLELKVPGKYPTPEQRAVHEALTLAGCVVRICRSVEDVQEFLSMLMPLRTRSVA